MISACADIILCLCGPVCAATIVDVATTAALLTVSQEGGVSCDLNCSYLSAAADGEEVLVEARVLKVRRRPRRQKKTRFVLTYELRGRLRSSGRVRPLEATCLASSLNAEIAARWPGWQKPQHDHVRHKERKDGEAAGTGD